VTTELTQERLAHPDHPVSGEASDDDLLRRIAAADRHAFEVLARRHYANLHRFVGRIIQRPHLAEEVANDTLLGVWRGAGGYAGNAKASTWIYGIANKKALKALQTRKRESANEDPEAIEDLVCTAPTPEHQAEQADLTRELRAALDTLTPAQRAVMELTYFQGHSCEEVAMILGCPVNTVKTRMFHARARLRKQLARQDWR